MSTDFQMHYRHNKTNLYIQVTGTFDGTSAHELLNLLQREYRGGNVFVDTASLGGFMPFGKNVLQSRLCQTPVQAASLFFKGEKGFAVAPSGSRVLLVKQGEPARNDGRKKHCCGNCANCTCRGKHKHSTDGHGHNEHEHAVQETAV